MRRSVGLPSTAVAGMILMMAAMAALCMVITMPTWTCHVDNHVPGAGGLRPAHHASAALSPLWATDSTHAVIPGSVQYLVRMILSNNSTKLVAMEAAAVAAGSHMFGRRPPHHHDAYRSTSAMCFIAAFALCEHASSGSPVRVSA